MKKIYEKPKLICEDLQPETMLCGCDVTNPQFSELEMCGYPVTIPGTDSSFTLFGQNWNGNCDVSNDFMSGSEYYMCYFGPVTSIFSS